MKRKLIVLGFCVMLLILFIQIAFALKTEKPNAAERLQAKIQAMDPKNEMVDLRTLNRRTFKKKDGKMITFIASEPLNYLEDDNRLYPIDINVTSEKPANANKTGKSNEPNKYRHHVLKNSIKARFTDESNGGVQLEYQKHSIEFVLDHKNKRQATVDKNKIRFNKVFNNGDLIYTILPGQVKDELIFSSPPKTPVISYKLKMSQKLTPQNGPKGSILLVDNTGKAVFELLPAFMFEKDNTSQCKDVETKFHWNKNELYCDMILDMSWLKDKKRHYPIVVDPIVSPAPTSSGKTENRTLIHCPEDWGTITCEIDLDGPGWHGNLASHSKSEVYFRDNMTGTKFLNYHDLNEYHPDPCTINIQAGHDYEVYLYGGKAHHIFAGNYTGNAVATITYGGGNGYLTEQVPTGNHFTGINNYVVSKRVDIKYPQFIKYKYVQESSNGNITEGIATPYFQVEPGSVLQPGSGEIRLDKGQYTFRLSPSNRNHYRVELDFPLGTVAYERKIVLRTNPGSIESTFMTPSDGNVVLQYETIQNGNPSNEAYPNIRITSGSEAPVFNKNFPLDAYNIYDGADKVQLQKEKLYTLTVSRGKSSGNGWGGVNLYFFFPQNKTDHSKIDQIQLIDKDGKLASGSFGASDYGLRFNYNDEESHTLKSYKLFIDEDEYPSQDINTGNGWISVPYNISDFKLPSGNTFQCQIETYDGFDFILSDMKPFTVDNSPPMIDRFTGEAVIQNGINSINLVCQAHDGASTVQHGELTWKINDESSGTLPWTAQTDSYTINKLPSSAKVEVTFSAADMVNNTASLTKVFYTYPEQAGLAAPVKIFTNKPGKYHPILKFDKTTAPEYRIQRFLKRGSLPDVLEYDSGFMDASTLSTVTLLPPGLNIIGPANNSIFGRPAFITLTAYSDTDSSIYKVDFYANGVLIETDTSSPFRILWNNVPPGDYNLTAVATDIDGISQISPSVMIRVTNIPPTVRLISPVNGTTYPQHATVHLSAEATDSDSDISKVEFFNGNTLIGTSLFSPFSMDWKDILFGANGSYTLSAKATDSDGADTTSDLITIYVTNKKPTVSIASPYNEQMFIRPLIWGWPFSTYGSASIPIAVNASDDGTISRVEFYADNSKVASIDSSPFNYTWSTKALGRHTLQVKAIDNNGAEAWSDSVYISVINPPNDLWSGRLIKYDDMKQIGTSPQQYWVPAGHWEDLTLTDDVNSSAAQWFFNEDCPEYVYVDEVRTAVNGYFTTFYWVSQDVTVTNYARNDDNMVLYLNNTAIYSRGYTGNAIDWNSPINVTLKGKQWNQIYISIDNSGGHNWELEFAYNFKYLIQQALNAYGGGTVYMTSSLSGIGASSMSMNSSGVINLSQSSTTQDVPDGAAKLGSQSLNLMSESGTTTNREYYSYMDLLPVDPHKTYVYRITTRNGDRIAEQDSQPVPVMNNIPEITGVEPNRDTKSYSNGAFSIRVTGAHDYDGDPLTYQFKIGSITSIPQESEKKEFTVTDLPDGTYTWSVKVSDGLGGEDTVSGTVIVDKTTPTALFSMNDSALFTISQAVRLTVSEATGNVDKIRISNDKNDKSAWIEYRGGNQVINWNLSPSDGRKVVYLQAHKPGDDETWGPVVERNITLDTTKPEVNNLYINQKGGDRKVTFDWSGGRDVTSGLSGKVNIQRWENGAWASYQTGYLENKIEIPAAGYDTPVKIRLQLSDEAGNLSDWSTSAEGYTKAAPGDFNKVETVSGYSGTTGYYIALKLKPAEGAVKYKLECVLNPGGGTSAFVPSSLTYQDNKLLAHRTYQYRVLTYNSNNEITEGVREEFTVANIPPIKPAGIAPKGLLKQKDGLEFIFSPPQERLDLDGDSLTVTYQLSTDGKGYQNLNSNIPTNLTEGVTYWWKATINDGYGGSVTTDAVDFIIDATAPSITVDNLSAQYALEHRVRINVSDSGSGVKTVVINGTPTSNLNSEITLNTQGANYLVVEATDQAGNTAAFTHTYYVDREPPICANISFGLPQRNGAYLANSNIVPVIWNAVDPESGVAKFKYIWSNDPGAMKEFSLLGQQGTYMKDVIGNFVDGHSYYLSLQAENYLGLSGTSIQSPPLLYDHSGPILSVSPLESGILFNGVRYLSSIQQLNLTVNAADPDTGINKLEYALVESMETGADTRWFDSLDNLKGSINGANGKLYYLAIRATNGTYLTKTVFSEPLIIDGSGPVLTVAAQTEQKDNQSYLAQVSVTDPDTMVTKIVYGMGTGTGQSNLSKGLPGADADGWLTVTYPENNLELRQYADIPVGTTYFVTVKATNITGITTVKSSLGTKIIGSNAPVVRDDGNYTSDNTQLHFEWSFPNHAQPIKDYRYKVRSADGTVLRNWQTALGVDSVLLNGLTLINNNRYYCDVQAVYEDGSVSEIGSSDGILVDKTAPEITSFIVPKYAGASGIDLTWAATDPESGAKCYAGIGINPGETGVTQGWICLGNLSKFRLGQDNAGNTIKFIHNQRYYVTIMIQNGAGLTVQQTGPAVRIDLTPPDPPVVIDEGNYTNRNDQLWFSWKWPIGDPESGIREYWIALTSQQSISGNEQWFSALQEKKVLLDDLELIQGGIYYLAVKAINNTGAESTGFSDGILIDITAPSPPRVEDFGDYSLSNTSLEVSAVASDAESGVAGYTLSLGTLEDPAGIIKERPVLADGYEANLLLDNLKLNEGKIYYFTVTAINNAGDESMVTSSDGIMVDSKLPIVESVTVQGRYLTDPDRLIFEWTSATSPSGIIDAQYGISADPNGTNLTWQSADLSGSQVVTGLNLEDGQTYYVFVRVQNRALAENPPYNWSAPGRSNPVAIDRTPPEIVNIQAPALTGQHFLCQWEARDATSGIAEYRYAVGSYRGGTDVTGGWVSVVTNETPFVRYRDDLPLQDNHSYYISVMAKDGAGLWSPVYKSGAIKTDLSPPVVSKLLYNSQYINIKDMKDGIHIEWAASDEQSGMEAYRMKLVTVKDNQDLDSEAVVTNETSGVIHLTELNVRDGMTYYIAFQAQNQMGAWSGISYTGPIRVDITAPTLSILNPALELVTNSGQMAIPYQVSEPASVQIKLTYPRGRIETPEPKIVAGQSSYDFNPQPDDTGNQEEGQYYLWLVPTDLANNPGVMAGVPGEGVPQVIRLNAKPIVNLGPDLVITKGTTVHFDPPEVYDSDGKVVEYQWDFGIKNDDQIKEAKPSCTYREVGRYRVTLKVKDNDGKWSDVNESSTLWIDVTNTHSGELLMNEDWNGNMLITGDVTVPVGKVLTIQAGTLVTFAGNYQLRVLGRLFIEGDENNPVTIGDNTAWNGIRFEQAEAGSLLRYVTIQNGTVGVLLNQTTVTLMECNLKGNRIGLHVIGCNPSIQNSVFDKNLIYGIKEDDGAAPTVTGCIFINNLVADYYEDQMAIIGMETLNQQGGNHNNIEL